MTLLGSTQTHSTAIKKNNLKKVQTEFQKLLSCDTIYMENLTDFSIQKVVFGGFFLKMRTEEQQPITNLIKTRCEE